MKANKGGDQSTDRKSVYEALTHPDRPVMRILALLGGIGAVVGLVATFASVRNPPQETRNEHGLPATTAPSPSAKSTHDLVSALSTNVQVERFSDELGPPDLQNTVGMYTEVIFVRTDYYIQAMTDDDGTVMMFSVTTRTPSFRPKLKFGPNEDVTLGQTKFGDVQAQPDGVFGYTGAHNFGYAEYYYFGNPGNYQGFVLSINEAGHAPENEVGPLFDLSFGDRFNGIIRAGGFFLGEPFDEGLLIEDYLAIAAARRVLLKVNTLTVTAPDFEFDGDIEELPFGPSINDVRVLNR